MAATSASELQGAIKSMAIGMAKGNTADTLGAPVDLVNTAIRPITERLGIATDTPFGGSAHFRTLFGMDVADKNVAETAGSMISVGGAVKGAIAAATHAPAIVKTGLATAAALVGGQEAIRAVGNKVPQKAVNSGIAVPRAQQGMIVGASRVQGVDVPKATELIKSHAEVNPASVYNMTGVYQGSDGGLRAVISDKGARLKTENLRNDLGFLNIPGHDKPLGDILEHPEFFKAYPDAAKIPVNSENRQGVSGSFGPLGITMQGTQQGAEAKTVSVLLHELQHYVQKQEGWTPGGSPTSFLPPDVAKQSQTVQAAVNKGRQSTDQSVKDAAERYKEKFNNKIKDAHIQYENLPGEQEARFTQQTKDYTQAQLAGNIRNQLKAGVTPQSWDTQARVGEIPKDPTKDPVAPAAIQESSVLDKIKNLLTGD